MHKKGLNFVRISQERWEEQHKLKVYDPWKADEEEHKESDVCLLGSSAQSLNHESTALTEQWCISQPVGGVRVPRKKCIS